MEHTPGPYHIVEDAGPTKTIRVFAGIGTPIAQVMRTNGEANAAFIVLAVNSHDALVEACLKLVEWDSTRSDGEWAETSTRLISEAASLARAAIEQATKEAP